MDNNKILCNYNIWDIYIYIIYIYMYMSNNKLLAKPLYVGCFHVGDGFLPYINQEIVYLLQPASPRQPPNR